MDPNLDSSLPNGWKAYVRFTKTSGWAAYAGCVWALLYAVFVRFYQAAGGTIGLSAPIVDTTGGIYKASYVVGVVIMLCGFVLLGLVKPWGKAVPLWIPWIGGATVCRGFLLFPTLLCSVFLIAHGAAGILTRVLYLAGLIDLKMPTFTGEVDLRIDALWDLFVYQPWFFIMGVLSGLSAAHYAQARDVSLPALKRGTLIFSLFTILVTAIFTAAIVFDFVDKLSFF
ncbi:DUF3995 domain-containing protein [Paenibacillus flagellatus]|uniref:DUF3995 domain-containing protein n=1 Tax=Paenibacillus flagellatus TaxID=2211139 RepID=A0A2V5KCI7_9BACL|nr:DUF3995 domain-containing protein [Paenibacillus flagellatus]PYI57325.1 DUF3995 domain-containing protein [Paenibacillus flagellatus]